MDFNLLVDRAETTTVQKVTEEEDEKDDESIFLQRIGVNVQ